MSTARPAKKPSAVHYLSEKLHPETLYHFLFAADPKKISPKEYYDLHFTVESYPDPKTKNLSYATIVGFNLSHTRDILAAQGDSHTLARFLSSKKTKEPATVQEWKACRQDDFQNNFTLNVKLLKEDYKAQFKLLLDTLQDLKVEAAVIRAAGCGNYGRGFHPDYQQAVADAYKEVLAEGNYNFKHLVLSEKDDKTRKIFASTLGGLMEVSDRNPEAIASEQQADKLKTCLVRPNSLAALKDSYNKTKSHPDFKGIGLETKEETSLEERLKYFNIIVGNIADPEIKKDFQKAAWDIFSAAAKHDDSMRKHAQDYPELFKPYLAQVEKFLQQHSQKTVETEIENLKSLMATISNDDFSEDHLKEADKLIKKCRTEAEKNGIKEAVMNKLGKYIRKSHAPAREKLEMLQAAKQYAVCQTENKGNFFTSITTPEIDTWMKPLQGIVKKQEPLYAELVKLDKQLQNLQTFKPISSVRAQAAGFSDNAIEQESWSKRPNTTFERIMNLNEESIADKKEALWEKIRKLEEKSEHRSMLDYK